MSEPAPLHLGVVCTAEEWADSQLSDNKNSTHPMLHCLTRGQSIGLTVTTQAAFISLIAVLYLFVLIVRNARRRMRDPDAGDWSLVREPADIYMLSLFMADLVQAVGTVLDIKWIHEGTVRSGTFCTTQGVIQQLGETPVAMNTLVIAIHTFVTVWWGKALHARLIALGVVTCIWVYVAIFIAVGVTSRGTSDAPYMTPTPYWCWIGPAAADLRIWGEYLWLWLALASSFILYVPLFFWSRGNLTPLDKWWKFKVHHKKRVLDGLEVQSIQSDHERTRKRVALGMLAYPLTYSCIVLPLSIVRWITFGSDPIASAWTFFIITVYGLSGFANVLLVLLTRPQLLLFGKPEASSIRSRGRARTPGDADKRARRRKGTALPSDSPSPSPSPPQHGNGWHSQEPTTISEFSGPSPQTATHPILTVTRTRASDEFNPYGNGAQDAYLLSHTPRASIDTRSTAGPSPVPWWGQKDASLRPPEVGHERV